MNNTDKRAVLQAALNGDNAPLKAFQSKRGRAYTAEETEQQRQYLSELYGYQATTPEAVAFFGRYDKSTVPGMQGYVLPNGMHLFF